jgi:hypothetical protein
MGLVAVGCPLPLTLGQKRVIIMVISMIFFFLVEHDVTCSKIIGNLKFKASVVFDPPWETPSFLLLLTLYAISFHSNASFLLSYIKEDY